MIIKGEFYLKAAGMVSQSFQEMIQTPKEKKRKRKNKYIPGLAAFRFRPSEDWNKSHALKFFNKQIQQIGSFKIDQTYFQDCIRGMQSLPTKSIDLIIADPPFGLDFSGKESIYNRDSAYVVEDYGEIQSNYNDFTERWIFQLPRIMKPTSSAYIFSGWTNLEDILRSIRKSGLTVLNHLIWQYQFGVYTKIKFVTSHYHILFLAKDPKKYYFNKIEHYPTDIWDIKREYSPGRKKNGTKLPVQLIQRCIDFSSKPGDIILDPFMGNGTTAEAAKANYRHFIGFEINEKMRSIIEQNLDMTSLGRDYRMYKTLLPSIDELKRKYPKAYEVFISEVKNRESGMLEWFHYEKKQS